MFKNLVLLTCIFSLSACGTVPTDQLPITSEKREFLFDYTVPGASKDELYIRANDYLAVSFNNSKVISRVDDKDRGAIIAKAVSNWSMTVDGLMITSIPCYSNYDIYIIVKEGRARLQLVLVPGAPNPSRCGWVLPPKRDYPQIVRQFDAIGRELGTALSGKGKIDTLNDF